MFENLPQADVAKFLKSITKRKIFCSQTCVHVCCTFDMLKMFNWKNISLETSLEFVSDRTRLLGSIASEIVLNK